MATSCKTTAHCHNQDVDIDTLHSFLTSADFIQVFFKWFKNGEVEVGRIEARL